MQEGTFNDVDALGKKLSTVINCSVRFHVDMFVCYHDLVFKLAALRKLDNLDWAKEYHEEMAK